MTERVDFSGPLDQGAIVSGWAIMAGNGKVKIKLKMESFLILEFYPVSARSMNRHEF